MWRERGGKKGGDCFHYRSNEKSCVDLLLLTIVNPELRVTRDLLLSDRVVVE